MSLKKLQELSGVDPDGKFGPNTFNAAAEYLGIKSFESAVHFFAQCAHETGDWKYFEENLNYSADALQKVWSKHFDATNAANYHRKPEQIANRAYRNRMGNGDEESGDGWKFRGRGAIQLTGRYNYQKFSVYADDHEILTNPGKVADEYSFMAAKWFFDVNKIWNKCEWGINTDAIRAVTKAINGGYNGLAHREELTNQYATYRWDGWQ